MRVFDAWINLNPPDRAQSGWQLGARQSLLRQFHDTADLMRNGMTVEQLIAAMDDAGIEAGLLTNHPFVTDYQDLMEACAEVAELCQRYPGRFFGSGRLDVLLSRGSLMNVVKAVDRMVNEFGFKAIRVVPAVAELPVDHRAYYPAYTKAAELGIPITLNVGLPGPSRPADTQRVLPLDRVCLDFPELKIVATHMGSPWHHELMGLMVKHPNLYLMTSAWAPKYYPPEIVAFMKSSRSADRVMFASDFPVLSMRRAIDELPLLGLSQEQSERFLWRNAATVFGFEDMDRLPDG